MANLVDTLDLLIGQIETRYPDPLTSGDNARELDRIWEILDALRFAIESRLNDYNVKEAVTFPEGELTLDDQASLAEVDWGQVEEALTKETTDPPQMSRVLVTQLIRRVRGAGYIDKVLVRGSSSGITLRWDTRTHYVGWGFDVDFTGFMLVLEPKPDIKAELRCHICFLFSRLAEISYPFFSTQC